MADDVTQHSGLSRRDFIRRSAVVGGAAIWAVPLVETLGETRAFAAGTTHFYCCYCYTALDARGCDRQGQCNSGPGAQRSATACDRFCQ
jgi:hypothetical protein